MKSRTVLTLAVLTLVMVVAAAVAVVNDSVRQTVIGKRVAAFPALVERINDAAAIEIDSVDEHFTIVGEGDSWGVVEKNGYPVARDTVRIFLLSLANLRIVEAKTGMADRYGRLEVADTEAAEGAGRAVTVLDKNGDVLADAIIGRRKYFLFVDGRGGTYMRRRDEAQSWLAEGEMNFGANSSDWMERLVFDVPNDDVRRIVITQSDGDVLRIEKGSTEDEHFAVANAPEGRDLKTETEADRLAFVVTKFQFKDVQPADKKALDGPFTVAEYTTFAGARIVFEVMIEPETEAPRPNFTRDPVRWARIRAELAPDVVTEETRAAAEARVNEVNAATAGWVFELENLDGNRTLKRLDDLYKAAGAT